jgi:hypothetical protein
VLAPRPGELSHSVPRLVLVRIETGGIFKHLGPLDVLWRERLVNEMGDHAVLIINSIVSCSDLEFESSLHLFCFSETLTCKALILYVSHSSSIHLRPRSTATNKVCRSSFLRVIPAQPGMRQTLAHLVYECKKLCLGHVARFSRRPSFYRYPVLVLIQGLILPRH